ncbi:MAG: glycoside hydrolase family 92 protein, partial [Acidimicrobiales bacterium]|nr:glycoside hydrolase family 92 protein [Acidimicrobiales bacterium]
LFNPATGFIQARGDDGSFPPGPAFVTTQFEPGGQLGFEEGNAVQYTWSVPQDLGALAALMGGDAAAAGKLATFFTSLNASRYAPYDWSGNEPSEWAPWEFDYFGAPDRTQGAVRSIVNTEYADAPVDEPGNDDLGALSSWYVWAALGFFPVTPGSATLALSSPLFSSVSLALPDGRRIVERAPGAAASRPYVRTLRVAGVARPASMPVGTGCASSSAPGSGAGTGMWDRPWLPSSVLQSGAVLSWTLASTPDPGWASSPADRPPSYDAGQLPAVGYSLPSGATSVTAGRPATVQIGAAPAGGAPTTVSWHVSSIPSGLTVTPTSGTLAVAACATAHPVTQSLTVTGTSAGSFPVRVQMSASGGVALPPVVFDVSVQP